MRHEMPFKNVFYTAMLNEIKSLQQDEPEKNDIISFGVFIVK